MRSSNDTCPFGVRGSGFGVRGSEFVLSLGLDGRLVFGTSNRERGIRTANGEPRTPNREPVKPFVPQFNPSDPILRIRVTRVAHQG